ncbi:phosphonate ABC transporter, permease protein PhnE [Phaeovulum sp.]|uniref:phosphonate ABC transporter, permease protein PhnE n=1 Tax=Phaeovulum sp. TaxID=2934796 RepID=UPI0027314791|nr:phosphonate ABC transporter, permease protein PhnE [Phaeovulum sp.]MDP1668681.1 phosphonate ABC transporter, permease protein PhnE [Phaeovulum sp.]MDZ4120395.1 phosphonate ABC transporter, permease protein PhnE [Phaeovulum sp.]
MVDIAFGPEQGKRPDVTDGREAYLELVRRKRMYGGVLLVLFVAFIASGWVLSDGRNAGGFWNGLPMLTAFPAEVLSEGWERRAALPGRFLEFFPSLIETLNIAAAATLLGAIAAAMLALLATRGLARWPRLIPLFRRSMDAARAVPEIVIALVLIYVLGGGPVPAVAAIALHTSGALGKLFSEVAENVDRKPVDGLAAVGATWGQRMWLGVMPQVAPNWLSYALLRFEINVRASAILGFVGEGGIGHDLKIAMQWGQGRYDQVVAIFLLLFLSIVAIDRLSDRYRNRLVKGH